MLWNVANYIFIMTVIISHSGSSLGLYYTVILQPWNALRNIQRSLFMFDSQPLSSVHVERPRSLTVAVAFGAILLPVAWLAVDLLVMNRQGGAI